MSTIDLQSRPALAPHVRLKIDPVSGEPVLLYPEGVLILNDTAHEIVQLCDGATTGAEVLAKLSAQYEVDEATLRDDVVECMADLLKRTLLVLKS